MVHAVPRVIHARRLTKSIRIVPCRTPRGQYSEPRRVTRNPSDLGAKMAWADLLSHAHEKSRPRLPATPCQSQTRAHSPRSMRRQTSSSTWASSSQLRRPV